MTKKPLDVTLTFQPVGTVPPKGSAFDTFILFNQCDGYHVVFGHWGEDGTFEGFFDFMGDSEYDDSFYEAWAKLPDAVDVLFPAFGSSPSRAAIARSRTQKIPPPAIRPEAGDRSIGHSASDVR